jgi:magnesium transporter
MKKKRSSLVMPRRAPVGSPPGILIPDVHASPTRLRLRIITNDAVETRDDPDLAALEAAAASGVRLWLDVVGLGDHDLLVEIGRIFDIAPLALEDITNTRQRPKIDIFAGHALVFLHMLDGRSVSSKEQIAILFDDRSVVTFQERPGDCLDPVRKRLAAPMARIRSEPPGYLAYAVIDTIIDAYFPVLETIGNQMEELEESILEHAGPSQISQLHHLKRELLVVKRAVWPTRELLASMTREDFPFMPASVRPFLRDSHDHAVQLIDIIETYRELGTGLLDLHLTGVSTRTNEIMKLLTIVATIFIPLTFLAGLWGMNFDPAASPWNMPELTAYFGYPAALLSMVATAAALLAYFRWKRWL